MSARCTASAGLHMSLLLCGTTASCHDSSFQAEGGVSTTTTQIHMALHTQARHQAS